MGFYTSTFGSGCCGEPAWNRSKEPAVVLVVVKLYIISSLFRTSEHYIDIKFIKRLSKYHFNTAEGGKSAEIGLILLHWARGGESGMLIDECLDIGQIWSNLRANCCYESPMGRSPA